jgi:protein required for attachment to host cells
MRFVLNAISGSSRKRGRKVMTNYYIVVAESTRARIFDYEKGSQRFEEICDLVHPQGRLEEQESNSDKPGRQMRGDAKAHHCIAGSNSNREIESGVFAKEICSKLETDRCHNKFDKLILIAPPHFLGELRDKMTPYCSSRVSSSIGKNLLHCSKEEILSHLTN